jgi:hypothetical protein
MPTVRPELTTAEFDQLRDLADRRRREVRQQAAYLIARALETGLDEPESGRGLQSKALAAPQRASPETGDGHER